MSKEIVVSGCIECPFRHYDESFGDLCDHPDLNGDFISLKYQHLRKPDSSPVLCPLKKESITIKIKGA
jgi:hypothetical protein